jgi:DNA repair protein RecO
MINKRFRNITGLVLGTKDTRDYDKVVVVFSPELGKVNLVCYGANRFKSRFSNKINVSNIIRGMVRYPSSIDKMISLEDVEVLADFFSFFKGNISKLSTLYMAMEIINLTLPYEVFDEYLYSITIKFLKDLAEVEEREKIFYLLADFSIRVLKNLGVLPYLKEEKGLSQKSRNYLISVLTGRDIPSLGNENISEILDWIENKILRFSSGQRIVSKDLVKESMLMS